MTALGAKVRDKVTGFEGVATARCEYLCGNPRVGVDAIVQGKCETQWFEELRLEEIGEQSA